MRDVLRPHVLPDARFLPSSWSVTPAVLTAVNFRHRATYIVRGKEPGRPSAVCARGVLRPDCLRRLRSIERSHRSPTAVSYSVELRCRFCNDAESYPFFLYFGLTMEQLTPHTQLVAANEGSIRMIARADILRHSLVGTICRLLPSMPMGRIARHGRLTPPPLSESWSIDSHFTWLRDNPNRTNADVNAVTSVSAWFPPKPRSVASSMRPFVSSPSITLPNWISSPACV